MLQRAGCTGGCEQATAGVADRICKAASTQNDKKTEKAAKTQENRAWQHTAPHHCEPRPQTSFRVVIIRVKLERKLLSSVFLARAAPLCLPSAKAKELSQISNSIIYWTTMASLWRLSASERAMSRGGVNDGGGYGVISARFKKIWWKYVCSFFFLYFVLLVYDEKYISNLWNLRMIFFFREHRLQGSWKEKQKRTSSVWTTWTSSFVQPPIQPITAKIRAGTLKIANTRH